MCMKIGKRNENVQPHVSKKEELNRTQTMRDNLTSIIFYSLV